MSDTKIIRIAPKSKWYLIDPHALWEGRELFYIFAWRDIKVRYKQTALGVAWVLFQPLVSTLLFTIFFGNFAKVPSQNLPYPVFVLLGLIYWGFFSTSLSHAATAFIENDSLVKKVYFPREILVFSSIVTASVDFLVSLGMLFPALLYYGIVPNGAFLAMLFVGYFVCLIASAGLGLFLASVNIAYRDVRYILPFFLQLLLFITPVIYPLNIVRPSYQNILAFNPLTGVIDGLRTTLASGTIVHPEAILISCISALLLLFLGLLYFRKTVSFFADIL